MTKKNLQSVRKKIDIIDKQLLTLINQRARFALEVGKIKQKSRQSAIYQPEREAQILRNVMRQNKGPLSNKSIKEIFLQIMAQCRALQKMVDVMMLGSKKDPVYNAAKKHFTAGIKTKFTNLIPEIFLAVAHEKVDFGIIPIESTLNNANKTSLACFLNTPISICGEIFHSPERFLIIGNQTQKKTGNDKTAFIIFTDLLALTEFLTIDQKKLEMTFFADISEGHEKIFFVEVKGHEKDKLLQKFFAKLRENNINLISLGSYPQAVL